MVASVAGLVHPALTQSLPGAQNARTIFHDESTTADPPTWRHRTGCQPRRGTSSRPVASAGPLQELRNWHRCGDHCWRTSWGKTYSGLVRPALTPPTRVAQSRQRVLLTTSNNSSPPNYIVRTLQRLLSPATSKGGGCWSQIY